MSLLKRAAGVALVGTAIGVVAEYAVAKYFFNTTIIRKNTKIENTPERERIKQFPHEEMHIQSEDGLKLYGMFFPCQGSKKVVICVHGYTSDGLKDYGTLALFYLKNGYNLLIVDDRAHGQSEGTYIGFGCLDKHDVKLWINTMIEKIGEDCNILLHGDSMGGATVLMTTGLKLPPQVKAVVSDCAFTSAKEVFAHVLKTQHHLPPTLILKIANQILKRKAGYELDECDARREVAKSTVPILFIHGAEDDFVPCSMVYELYDACQVEKKLVIVEGARHFESYYLHPDLYETAIEEFIFPMME
jgi:fermentation-respiration switch protein FrsA (DUF1100 family)